MSIAELVSVLPPPSIPTEVGPQSDWADIEIVLGTPLPQDYKDYINSYGTGSIFRFFQVLSPFSAISPCNLCSRGSEILDAYRVTWAAYPQYSPPYPPFPEPDGLLPWPVTDNGDTACWLTKGAPDDWIIVVCDNKFSEEHDEFQTSMTGFLAGWIRQEMVPVVFPDNVFTLGCPPFQSYEPR
jgi:hypothetical protein